MKWLFFTDGLPFWRQSNTVTSVKIVLKYLKQF